MNLNKKKFEIFLEVARAINASLGFTPILYASLGLNRVIGEFGEVDDIDVMVPDDLIIFDWASLVDLMESLGFALKDTENRCFVRDGEEVVFEKESELKKLTGEDPDSLDISEENGVRFKELTPTQYRRFYEYLISDPARIEKRKKDELKLMLINRFVEEHKV